MPRLLASGQFLVASGVNVAAGTTLTEGADFTSEEVEVSDVETFVSQIEGTPANASISSTLDVWWGTCVTSGYDTGESSENRYAMTQMDVTTNSQQRASDIIDVTGAKTIKVIKLVNNDSNYAVNIANVNYSKQRII